MSKYCFDTSGISNPVQNMPDDLFPKLWSSFCRYIDDGSIAVTKEIFDEMCLISGRIGQHIQQAKKIIIYEVLDDKWDWSAYIDVIKNLQTKYQNCLSERNGGNSNTICANDLTIIALAKVLKLPVVSMESKVRDLEQSKKRRIPNICEMEDVTHLTFNDFLRQENLTF